ncbi:MAG: epimerase, partial [Armatimonadetes bacterium]|nr:epimerase [Armatimonadota bacterium]
GDVVITWDEIAGLSQDLLVSGEPPTCPAKLSDWLQRNAATVGNEYHSELARHYR